NKARPQYSNDHDEHVVANRSDAADEGDTLTDLYCREAKGGCRAKECCNDRKNVDQFPSKAIGLRFAEQCLEDRRNECWASATERCIGQCTTDERVHAPDVQAPVIARL